MKQLLLRVPEATHRRLTARARREGRSVNALATEVLDAAADADVGDRRARLREQAMVRGSLRSVAGAPIAGAERTRILESARGLGRQIDAALDRERDPR